MQKKFIINKQNVQEYITKIGTFIKSKVERANCSGAVIGMSGGIDCSVAACLCKAAGLSVLLLILPDGERMRDSGSMNDALNFANKFSFEYRIIDIDEVCLSLERALGELSGAALINIRPRVRMTALYSVAQTENRLVVGTGNLDERLMGYFTKWGDGACDVNPLGMLTKGEIRLLASVLDVPREIILKAPSADLYPDQTDEKELGLTYEQIDGFILNGTSKDAVIDEKINKRIDTMSHKLLQIPIFEG